MKIGIEAERANNPVKTGVEHYSKQLILNIAKIDSENEYVLYLRTKPESWFLNLPKNFTVKVIPFPIFWTQIRLSLEMLFNPVDLLFIPASAIPIYHPKNTIVTIHDLAWKYFPESFTWFTRNFLEYSTWLAVKKAMHLIAVSEATKKDLVKFYNVSSDKISVVHHGYESSNELQVTSDPDSKDNKLSSYRAGKLKLPKKYILFLSTLQPRKNLEGLIKAFKDLKAQNPELPHKLVVIGKPGWKFESILKKIEENKDIVEYLNYLPDQSRLEVLKKAELLVLPSFYEGFGMQILEAFALGVPVVTSNISSMPEVAGGGAVYFNPHAINEIKDAIKQVILDKSLRESLVEKGAERLKNFSWQKCAEQTLKIFNNLC